MSDSLAAEKCLRLLQCVKVKLTQNPDRLVDFEIETQPRKFLTAPDMSRPGVLPCHVAARKLQQIAADSTKNCRFYRPCPATSQASGHHPDSAPAAGQQQATTSGHACTATATTILFPCARRARAQSAPSRQSSLSAPRPAQRRRASARARARRRPSRDYLGGSVHGRHTSSP